MESNREDIRTVQPNSTEPGDVVNFTQHMRFRMFDELTDNGVNLTAKFAEVRQLICDMDNAALTTRKLNIEEKDANNGKLALQAFKSIQNMLGNRDPFMVSDDAPLPIAERVDRIEPDNFRLPHVDLLQGEDAQGEQPLSIHHYVPSDD